jgi:hypothetical protein
MLIAEQKRLSPFALLVAMAVCCLGCSEHKRPSGVALAAVRVEGAKTGYWQVCNTEVGQVRCTIWNDGGTVLKSEPFLPLDEGPALQRAELQIRASEICIGPYEVCLSNGRILLPESQFEELKVFMKR